MSDIDTASSTPRLALGPVLYYWPRDVLLDFYKRIAETAVDIVYLGETVCSKRRAFNKRDWLDMAERLERAGKQVVLSSMTLIEAGSELSALRSLGDNGRFLVEANDVGAIHLLSGKGPFVTGPGVNIYHDRTLGFLAGLGLKRWVLPLELSRDTLADIQTRRPPGVETEVFAWGRLPLAYSARCFTARAHNLSKDDCQFRCLDYPDGLMLATREDESFLVINGIQTQSAQTFSLLGELDELAGLNVDVLRISPQSAHTERIIELFHARRAGLLSSEEASSRAEACMSVGPCDGYWFGHACMERRTPNQI